MVSNQPLPQEHGNDYYVRMIRDARKEHLDKEIELDLVNSPPHYNQAGIETIDAIQAATNEGFEYYLQGNIIKYLWRYRYKNGVQDLEKAQWYLNKLIQITTKK